MNNSKKTRRALLSSFVALALCFSMFAGTTMAWFTDNAATGSAVIKSGKLDIDITDGSDSSLVGQTLTFKKSADAAAGEELLWEPGCTYELQDVYVENIGNLALKYKIAITGVEGDGKLSEVIDWTIKVNGSTDLENYEGKLGVGASEKVTIKGHMSEEAGNDYQNLTITGLAITVTATQDTVEYDSTTNQYDANAEYPVVVYTAEELANALKASKNVIVGSNINLAGTTVTVPADVTATLDLNGKTISDSTTGTGKYMFRVENSAKLRIIDSVGTGKITFASTAPASNKAGGAVVHAMGELVMDSGTLEMTGAWGDSFVVTVHPNAWGSAYTAPTTFTMNGGEIISSDSGVRVASFSDNSYTDDVASFIMNGGRIDSAKDGIFVHQPEAVWDALNVTVNGGVIEGDRNPIRICEFGFTSSDVDKCITINLSSNATLTYTGTDTPTDWIVAGKIRYSCYGSGSTLEVIMAHTIITIDGETFNL